MATISPPISHSEMETQLGYSYTFAKQDIALELQDKLNVLGLGVVPLLGDLSGTGSDTLRVTHVGGIGYSVAMDDLASETDTITPKSITVGYSTVTIAQMGIGFGETYQDQILGRIGRGVDLDSIVALLPESWLKTFRQKYAVVGSNFSTAIGSATRALSVTDWLNVVAAYEEALGSTAPTVVVDPVQRTQLRAAFRNEPAFQSELNGFASMQSYEGMQIHANFASTGITLACSDDVQQANGAYQGFAHSAGGVGWGVGSTLPVKPANPQGAVKIPQFGILIEEVPGAGSQGQRQAQARAWFGLAARDSAVATLRRLISLV